MVEPEKIDMLAGLREVAARSDAPTKLGDAVYERLPTELQQVEVTRDAESGHLYYNLGRLIDRLPGNVIVWANRESPALHRLWRCVVACMVRLDNRSGDLILGQLAHVLRHKEWLEEVSVMTAVPDGVRADYEVPLLDGGTKTVDWQFTPPRGPVILLEVKARSADLVEHFKEIVPQLQQGATEITDIRAPDASLLFKSIDQKFPARPPGLFLHGA